jgi:hypothetical protein
VVLVVPPDPEVPVALIADTRPMTAAELTEWLHQHGVAPGPDTDRLLAEYAGKSLAEMDEENDRINGRMA